MSRKAVGERLGSISQRGNAHFVLFCLGATPCSAQKSLLVRLREPFVTLRIQSHVLLAVLSLTDAQGENMVRREGLALGRSRKLLASVFSSLKWKR